MVDFGNLVCQLCGIALGQTAGNDELLAVAVGLELAHFQDGVDGFFFGGSDEATRVNNNNLCFGGVVRVAISLDLAHTEHHFGIHAVFRATQRNKMNRFFSHDRTAVAIMTRAPVPGETKTRLEPAIGPEKAALLAAAFIEDTVAKVRAIPTLEPILLVAGDIAHAALASLECEKECQRGRDLGARIEHAMETALACAPQALVIGCDSPTLPARYLERAGQRLARNGAQNSRTAVLGPAADGGFYLLGSRSWTEGLLHAVPWSRQTTYAHTNEVLNANGYHVTQLPPWYDVDTPTELALLRAHLLRRPKSAPKTAACLFSWCAAKAAPY